MTPLAPPTPPPHAPPPWVQYCCPLCKGPLATLAEAYRCDACQRDYPVVWSIPDFRVFPDPYIGIEDDRRKGLKLAARYASTDFEGLARYYWSLTPDTPPDFVREYLRHDLAGVDRGRQMLAAMRDQPGGWRPQSRVLEIGTRTGGFLVAAAAESSRLVGCDIAFRWLVVARKRLEEHGLSAPLVCCCGQHLPFPNEQFDQVVAGNVLEHTTGQEQLVGEACRVLGPGRSLFATTWNRFSLAPEPHVGVWGVGFLPRRLMTPYVRWRRGADYRHVRLLSLWELRRLVGRTPFRRCRIVLPSFAEGELKGLSPGKMRLARLYNRIRNWPLVRQALMLLGPGWQVTCVRPAEET